MQTNRADIFKQMNEIQILNYAANLFDCGIFTLVYDSIDNTWAIRGLNASKPIKAANARTILMASDSDDQAIQDLQRYFWGETPIKDLPRSSINEPQLCSHDWHEVTLFVTPQLRCRFCDMPKAKYDSENAK